jgi:hypothetical protein
LSSWNFLSASCMFWLTMSSNISMKFSVISCRISFFRVFLWTFLGSLAYFIFVLWKFGSGYVFSSFLSESCTNIFLWGEWFPSLFCLPIFPLGTVSFSGLCVI